jgi:hypothetical protein
VAERARAVRIRRDMAFRYYANLPRIKAIRCEERACPLPGQPVLWRGNTLIVEK